MTDVYLEGVVRRPVLELRPGDRVDLERDSVADPYDPDEPGITSEHPEFAFEYEVVLAVERETEDCVRVDFESGFSCGFPADYLVEVGPAQHGAY